MFADKKVHADDMPVAVFDAGRGRTKTGRLWVYVRDNRPAGGAQPPAAWYRYSPNRNGVHSNWHLATNSGVLQVDAYGEFVNSHARGRVVEASCWAQARRPFWRLHASQGLVSGSVTHEVL